VLGDLKQGGATTMNILIVDDQEENRYLLETLLKASGHHAQSAVNGADALEILTSDGIDLIVSDILMPVMDGFQLCRTLKADERLRVIPVIIYTATYTGPQDEALALKLGAARFIVKPCEPDLFLKAMDEVMAEAARQGGASTAAPAEGKEVFQLYNERLVRKLEQKMVEAERELHARQAAEQALRDSKTRLIAAQRIAKMGDFSWNAATCAITWSEAMFDLLGYETSEAIDYASVNTQIHHPEDREDITKWLKACMASGRAKHGPKEYRIVRKDGGILHVQAFVAIEYEHGTPVALFGTIQDITERKQAERALRESEHRSRTIIENSRDIIYTLNADGRFLFVSPAMRHLLGYDETAMVGRTARSIIHPDEVAACEQAMRRILTEGIQTPGLEYRIRHANGEWRWFTSTGGVVHDANGNRLHFQGMARDITDRRKLEEQLRQSQKMESVGRLAGGVAHDYNNMLSVILGYTELALAQVPPTEPLHADLKEIFNAANRSADITRQLLAFARRQTITPEVLDLNASVEGLLKMLRRLIGEDIDLAWLPGTDLWPVRMDPSQLNQILANLCVNARDAIADVGKIIIETKRALIDEAFCADHPGFRPGEYVLLAISDDGCGMDKQILTHLFEPFFTTKEIGKGTGLGLAMVYGIVKQNDGFIAVYSEAGKGSTFRIYLPRHAGRAGEISVAKAEEISQGRGETVLVVEDEEAILALTRKMLEKLGYQVLTAHDPGDAIGLTGRCEGVIQLLITDVVMPTMNGRELAERLRSICPDLKCLFMSGYTADAIAHRGVLDKGVRFLQKPFSTNDLARRVREALDNG